MRHIISVLMENEPGALSRVVGLFSQRNYNIDSLTVAPTDESSLSRLTLTTEGDDAKIEQITKHLNKLVDVVKLVDLTDGAHIERELMLVKVKASGSQREEVQRLVEIFRGQIVDLTANVFSIQLVGTGDKLDAFVSAQADASVIEVARTGVTGVSRGEKVLSL
jgi:acetolactate synthase-1/3 small subunit